MTHKPLKIVFRVAGGLVLSANPIHFDAVLAYAQTQSALDNTDFDNTDAMNIRTIATSQELPLAKHEQGGDWVWKSSAATLAGPTFGEWRFFNRSIDEETLIADIAEGRVAYGGRNGKMYDPARGMYRKMADSYPIQRSFNPKSALIECVFWSIGDEAGIRQLLDSGYVTHLGALRRMGHGRIVDYSIDEDADALQNWKLRVRPWQLLDDDVPVQSAWRPPYWAADHRGQAFAPATL